MKKQDADDGGEEFKKQMWEGCGMYWWTGRGGMEQLGELGMNAYVLEAKGGVPLYHLPPKVALKRG